MVKNKNKNSIILYTDYLKQLAALNMEQRGILLTALLKHQAAEPLPDMDEVTNLCFLFISADIDRANEHYNEIVAARRTAGRASANKRQQKATKSTNVVEKDKEKDKDKDKDKDKVKDKDNDKEREFYYTGNPPAFIPSVDEVQTYITEQAGIRRVRPDFDANRFLTYYNARGWMAGSTRLTDWRALVDSWLEKTDDFAIRDSMTDETEEEQKRRLTSLLS